MTGQSRWISLGMRIGGPSPAVRADLALPPCERKPPRWDTAAAAERAEWEIGQAGYEPLAPYPGRVDAAWRCRCTTCGALRTPSLSRVRRSGGCTHKRPASTSDQEGTPHG
ncbi:hypothetical protein LRS74_22515 [Streptomyces sp. LX-29]|uniref:hypothetical protein n=1 Tax=Streptomyces sp. LX-29 TaxID=2900152 RepID=UPI00240E1B69|nr:hypothetical protein [Streptomyces sp. LX-29]WFB09511.1 hypothetical protein LRS74_22515 [Streptomyces sp. LX-29]